MNVKWLLVIIADVGCINQWSFEVLLCFGFVAFYWDKFPVILILIA